MPTTSDFWGKGVVTDDIVGGPARILVAQRSLSSYPELISDVLTLDTYQPVAPWVDLGHTSEPFESSEGFDETEWISQQQGRINVQVAQWNRNITVAFMQSRTNRVMDVVHEADGRTTNADGDEVVYFWDQPDITEWRLAAINLQESRAAGTNLTMDVFPKVKKAGADSTTSWDRDSAQMHSVELTPFPDTGVPLNANWYRITQL